MEIKLILIILLIVIGMSIVIINISDKKFDIKSPESHWYICDTISCQEDRYGYNTLLCSRCKDDEVKEK